MRNVNSSEVVRLLRKVAKGREDYVYVPPEGIGGQCRYLDDAGNPSCIVGHVLVELGVPVEAIGKVEGRTAREDNGDFTEPLSEHVQFTRRAVRALSAAQVAQDQGSHPNSPNPGLNWGDAVRAAVEAVS